MKTYSVGDETKESILKTSRRLFYEKGVAATSYDDICKGAQINRGLIPYHFKGKNNIAGIIFNELIGCFNVAISNKLQTDNKNIHHVVLMFREAKNNENFCRFYSEVENSNDCYEVTLASQMELIQELSEYNGLTFSESALRTIGCMYEGTERELADNLYRGYLTEPIDEIVKRDTYFVFSSLGFETKQIDNIFKEAKRLADGFRVRVLEQFELKII